MKCACDVCDTVFGVHDARSPDGYCGFCSANCFPLGEISGKPVRTALGKTSRSSLHGMARVTGDAIKNPKAAADSARRELAEAAVTVLGPMFQKAGKLAVEKIREKIRGR